MDYAKFENGVRSRRGLVTDEGGFASLFWNRTGADIPHGSACSLDPDNAGSVKLQSVEFDVIGFAYGDIKNGQEGWVVCGGIAEALLADGTSAEIGSWSRASETDGRIEVTTPPSGLGALATSDHFKEVGHCLDVATAGTDKLVRIVVHPL